MSDEIARVVMLWPAELKAEIQREVGKRGLTGYVLDAVREKRSRPQRVDKTVDKPGAELQTPVQTCVACGTDLDAKGWCWFCGS